MELERYAIPWDRLRGKKKNYSFFLVIHEGFTEMWLMALWTDVISSSLQA